MLRVRTKQKDLQQAAKNLKRVVSREVRLKKPVGVEYENTVWRKRCFIRYDFKGDATKLERALGRHGFHCEVKEIAGERKIALTKTFVYCEQVFTARLAFRLDVGSMTMSISVEPLTL